MAGGKLTGSLGGFPIGRDGCRDAEFRAHPTQTMLLTRLKRSLWSGSYVGVMGIDKRSGNPTDSFNQSSGADARLVFRDWS